MVLIDFHCSTNSRIKSLIQNFAKILDKPWYDLLSDGISFPSLTFRVRSTAKRITVRKSWTSLLELNIVYTILILSKYFCHTNPASWKCCCIYGEPINDWTRGSIFPEYNLLILKFNYPLNSIVYTYLVSIRSAII